MQYEQPEAMNHVLNYMESATVGDVLPAIRATPDRGAAQIMLSWMLWANHPNRTEIDFSRFEMPELLRMAAELNPTNLAYGSAASALAGVLAEYAIGTGRLKPR